MFILEFYSLWCFNRFRVFSVSIGVRGNWSQNGRILLHFIYCCHSRGFCAFCAKCVHNRSLQPIDCNSGAVRRRRLRQAVQRAQIYASIAAIAATALKTPLEAILNVLLYKFIHIRQTPPKRPLKGFFYVLHFFNYIVISIFDSRFAQTIRCLLCNLYKFLHCLLI